MRTLWVLHVAGNRARGPVSYLTGNRRSATVFFAAFPIVSTFPASLLVFLLSVSHVLLYIYSLIKSSYASWKEVGVVLLKRWLTLLTGHGNEPNFPRFLHKSFWPRSLTLYFEPFRFRLRIRGDIRIRKTTPRIGESGSRQDCLEYPFFSNL